MQIFCPQKGLGQLLPGAIGYGRGCCHMVVFCARVEIKVQSCPIIKHSLLTMVRDYLPCLEPYNIVIQNIMTI